MELKPIGKASTPYRSQAGAPIQAVYGEPVEAVIRIDREYREGLADLEGFDRIWLICFYDRCKGFDLQPVPYRDTERRGVFATRAPRRPNPIGLSCVELLSVDVESGELRVKSIDLLDGTPILDIKPYIPSIDAFPGSISGWFERGKEVRRADRRFESEG